MTRLLLALVRVYQVALSPFLGRSCRFHPSCSHYAAEAIRVHGPAKGSLLAAGRICRCNPWHPGGYDPVPPAGRTPAQPVRPDTGSGAGAATDGPANAGNQPAERSVDGGTPRGTGAAANRSAKFRHFRFFPFS